MKEYIHYYHMKSFLAEKNKMVTHMEKNVL